VTTIPEIDPKKMKDTIVREKLTSINNILAQSPCREHGLAGGSLGLSYYYFHAGRALEDDRLADKGASLLQGLFEDLNTGGNGMRGSFLCDGGAGLGYVMNYLQGNGFLDFDVDEELVGLDEFLFESALAHIGEDNMDFLYGSMGIFYYFATRRQTPAINRYLNELAQPILAKPIHTDYGVWVRNLGLTRDKYKEVNFSLSHGMTGYLLPLIAAWPHLRDKETAEKVIRQGINFMMKYECPVDFGYNEYSYFPCYFLEDDGEMTRINRLAWCYGDLNEVLLLYRAGKLLGDDRYLNIANRIGLQTVTRRSYESTLSQDTHFCHGHSGLARFYKSLFIETGIPAYKAAADYWLDAALSLIDKEIVEGHYSANNVSLLEGWAGVGLVLADHLLGWDCSWARILLL
jgi:lantibiotic biosynthesis protein